MHLLLNEFEVVFGFSVGVERFDPVAVMAHDLRGIVKEITQGNNETGFKPIDNDFMAIYVADGQAIGVKPAGAYCQ